MGIFREFEIEALRLLLSESLSPEQLRAVENFTGASHYEYTGSGYFLTVRDPVLPTAKSTCAEPPVIGEAGDVRCGFLAFLGENELTLECHTWGAVDVPADFRDRDVRISITKVTRIGRAAT